MNKLSSFALAASFLAAVSVLGPERAHADATVRPSPTIVNPGGGLPQFAFTTVKGSIKVGAVPAPSGQLAGWNCDDLVASVESKERIPPAAGNLFSSAKWSRSVKATGNWASGTCSFSINVVPNSEFFVTVGPSGKDYPCDYIGGMYINPGSTPAMSVPKGTSKNTPDFTAVGQPKCSYIQ